MASVPWLISNPGGLLGTLFISSCLVFFDLMDWLTARLQGTRFSFVVTKFVFVLCLDTSGSVILVEQVFPRAPIVSFWIVLGHVVLCRTGH
jgi:hypothetical protein